MNILLANNNELFAKAVKQSLRGYDADITLSNGTSNIINDIQKSNSQMVMINWSPEEFNITSLCKKIKRLKKPKNVYILVVTSRNKNNKVIDVINSGADDFIFRPFNRDELISRIKIAEKTIKLEIEVAKAKKKIIKLVKEDPVTNLFNRRALLDEVLKEMGRASRETHYIAALMTSIINFKKISESYGVEVIETILSEFGRRLKSSCRPYDKVGRYNISDFLLFIPGAGIANAEKVARRIIATVKRKPFYAKGKKVNLTVSIGISELDPKEIAKDNKVDDHLVNDLLLDALIKRTEMAVKKTARKNESSIKIYKK